ncbi:exodeoxyribonuclease V subunit gamma [Halosquirtibacter laminarini]|uniref:Exodeoxyribonuclease V subunit gamma n=1 Tax=Halosquirtibacter laminarini TaxID=3374600 RepID=A0AC61NMF7_9BACT|nr:exodeoxyribonuclease V subunit gamma [Prolixibacteraceae bacterium]
MYDYLETLNTPQRNAVENIEGPTLVIAGAGSGKTRVLTYRIAHLINKGVSEKQILALTFTNKAAREMKERISNAVGEECAKNLWMGTFHSLFSKILRIEAEIIGYPSTFTIYDTQDSKSVIKSIIKNKKLDDKIYRPTVVQSRISTAKNNLVTPQSYLNNKDIREADKIKQMPQLGAIYLEYTRRCKKAGAMDFDDLLLETNILFRDHPEVLEKYQRRFHYILVDEYQDTNFSQYLIIKKLAALKKNLCVVGDDAQSIYSFRGAKIENILNFKNDYPEFKTFKLEQNYRSTRTIVEAANSVIKKNSEQIPKKTYSENELGERIELFNTLTDNEEGIEVAKRILQIKNATGCNYENFSILYRTNAQSRIFEECLRKRNIPYKIFGGLSFYQRKEIKDVLAYFKLIVNPQDDESLKRIINFPTRGIGATTVTKLENAAAFNDLSIFDIASDAHNCQLAGLNAGAFRKVQAFVEMINDLSSKVNMLNAFEMVELVCERTNILEEYDFNKNPENKGKTENIQELMNGIKDFTDNSMEEGKSFLILDYISEVALLTDQDKQGGEDTDRVTLMTVHSSKGLEFKNVFIVGLEEKLFPSIKETSLNKQELEEERRLFYVAVTRAEKKLCLSFVKQRSKWGKIEFCTPSRFLSEIDSQYLKMPLESESNIFIKRKENQRKRLEQHQYGHLETQDSIINSIKGVRLDGKIKRMEELAQIDKNVIIGANPEQLKPQTLIKHQRFGTGVILSIEGKDANKKAVIEFDDNGTKTLLLRFAKLQIID